MTSLCILYMYVEEAGLTDGRQEFKRLVSTRVRAARDVFQGFWRGQEGGCQAEMDKYPFCD
ncbi:hypothetical protein D3C78_1841140 [compost metagenome]